MLRLKNATAEFHGSLFVINVNSVKCGAVVNFKRVIKRKKCLLTSLNMEAATV